MLSSDENFEKFFNLGATFLLRNSLFLYFCLSLLNDQEYFPVTSRKNVRERLESSFTGYVDLVQVDFYDLAELFPVLDVSTEEDDMISEFTFSILLTCRNSDELIFGSTMTVYKLVTS